MGPHVFPQIFGKYVLERPIAMGGMARVFLATLRGAGGFEKKLVVKQIRAELATDEAFVRRFVAEAKTTVELSHPNIVPVYELGVEQGVYYLAMELCAGVSLDELIDKTGKLSPEEGAYVGVEICRALDYAHRKARIIHRDVTPRNVMIDEEGGVRLIDFGIAAPAFSGVREVFGSPGHMPPEQIAGETVGPPADVFAVAVLLYEAWTHSAPFRRATPELTELAMKEPVRALSTFDPAFADLDAIVEQALSMDPKSRPQSAEDLSRALRKFIAGSDLGDLAKHVGAKVAKVRAAMPDHREISPEATPEAHATRTFATRPVERRPDEPQGGAAPGAPPDVSTRKMREEEASWSTGRRARLRSPRRNNIALGLLALAVAGAMALAFTSAQRAPLQAPRVDVSSRVPEDVMAKIPREAEAKRDNAAAPTPSVSSAPAETHALREGSASKPFSAAVARVLANPPAKLEVDGRLRGSTPIHDLHLDPGIHEFHLTCAALAESITERVRIGPGESITLAGDFTGAQPSVSIRRAPSRSLNP